MEEKNQVWVYCDLRTERLFGFSLNVLTKGRDLAEQIGGKAVAVIMGASKGSNKDAECLLDGSRENVALSIDQAVESALSHGADRVAVIDNKDLAIPRVDLFSTALAQIVEDRLPRIVLFALSDFGRDLAARTARHLDLGLIADCADLQLNQDKIVATCSSWGGEIMAQITFSDGQTSGFATVQPAIAKAVEQEGIPGDVETIAIDSLVVPKGVTMVERRQESPENQGLEEAEIVVVGGAGVGSAEGFGKLRELAASLGAEIGATRPPVLQHWVEEKRLIGQTGKTVRPKLLLSVGTSGAVQYTAGITEADKIVAINRDKKAPIFAHADIGLVGDWSSVVPLLTDRVRQQVMRQLADGLCDVEGEAEVTSFGTRICRLREGHGWSQEALSQAMDQTPDYIAQVEKDEVAPPVSFLLRLSRVLGIDPSAFLREEEKVAIRDQRTQGFVKRTKNYSYQTLTPDAEAEHLRAFMVTIEPKQAHEPVAYKHEGEEFIFVLNGELELTLGGKPHHLKTLESIRFNSDVPHKLKSLSDEQTQCLVVLYSP